MNPWSHLRAVVSMAVPSIESFRMLPSRSVHCDPSLRVTRTSDVLLFSKELR